MSGALRDWRGAPPGLPENHLHRTINRTRCSLQDESIVVRGVVECSFVQGPPAGCSFCSVLPACPALSHKTGRRCHCNMRMDLSEQRRSTIRSWSAMHRRLGSSYIPGLPSQEPFCPTRSTLLDPINENLDLNYPAGVRAQYFYPNRSIFGFSTGGHGSPTIMPIVGNWTVPPSAAALCTTRAGKSPLPGYYSVYLDDFHTRAEMTVTTWTGLFRFTFPQYDKAHVLLDLGHEAETWRLSTIRPSRPCGQRPNVLCRGVLPSL